MEVSSTEPSVIRQNIHLARAADPTVDDPYGVGVPGHETDLGAPRDLGPHRYGVYFDGQVVKFYVDRQLRMLVTREQAQQDGKAWPFDKPEHIVLNIAVSHAAAQTRFPVSMTVSDISAWKGGVPSS